MQSGNQESFLNFFQKSFLIILFIIIFSSLIFFKNLFFQPTLILKNFGESSVDPEIAFLNQKPTFLEFYAEWCEICKEMAPKISLIKEEYDNDINFVFLNVDNPKWEPFIKKFEVNGIPQVNLFDSEANLRDTIIGRQDENTIKNLLENLNNYSESSQEIVNDNFVKIKNNKTNQISPRSHG